MAVTTLRPHANCSCEIAAKYPHLGRHPTATESEPVRVEEGNHAATVVVLVTALTCDVVGSVMNFDRSPERTRPTQCKSPKVNRGLHRGCDDTETECELLMRRRL